MPINTLPNLFLIGAPKCGTSSLHFYLDQHPDISMSAEKEPYVFDSEDWRVRLARYEGQFDLTTTWRGESSVRYTMYPKYGDVPARIYRAVPDARLLYLVGDPIERLISHYVQAVAGGVESRSIEEALSDFTNPRNPYVSVSCYATQIDRYLAHFDLSSLCVLEQSELRHDQPKTLGRVFAFLDVDADFRSWRYRTEVGTRRDQVRFTSLGGRLRETKAGRAVRSLPLEIKQPIIRTARLMLARKVTRPQLAPALRAELVDFLRPEIERLRGMTGMALEDWPDRNLASSSA